MRPAAPAPTHSTHAHNHTTPPTHFAALQNDSIATLLARLEGILGPMPRWMLLRGRYAHKYFLRDGRIFEKSQHTGRFDFLRPKATSLARRVPQADEGMLAFLNCLLQVRELL